jgi:D-beta-D-heptose 7-phosphate kinase/D-beta-D-heptose 1-phosphate adenosyltransferase
VTEVQNLEVVLASLTDARVLCIGDVMLDRFVYGSVDRVSPEAPIPIVKIDSESVILGGAGNVARNIAALGAHAMLLSVVGDDSGTGTITDLLEREPRIEADLLSEANRRITVKTRYVASGQQLLRADWETDSPISETIETRLLATFERLIDVADVVVLSDYGKGVLSDTVLRAVVGGAKARGKTVLVDPKGRDFRRYGGASIVTPNERELAAASGMATVSEAEVTVAGQHIIRECGIEAVLVTRSSRGISIVRSDSVEHLTVKAREVFDVSGAGDTVIAAAAAALGSGASLLDSAVLANYAAGVVVAKVGTAVVYPTEIQAALRHPLGAGVADKLVELDSACDRIESWRRQGLKIGFTNGCFDVLHPGHVHLLEQARAVCDRLIVGLNSDSSIVRLKGPERPIHAASERTMMLGSHGTVDLVVVFDADTPLALIEALRPDVLIKGADYTMDEVVGGDMVRAYGGQVVLATLKAGYSTTEAIARLRRTAAL